jgi:hypothetical protein
MFYYILLVFVHQINTIQARILYLDKLELYLSSIKFTHAEEHKSKLILYQLKNEKIELVLKSECECKPEEKIILTKHTDRNIEYFHVYLKRNNHEKNLKNYFLLGCSKN